MTLRQALLQASSLLASHGIEDARLEAELLLMHTLGIERSELYVRLEQPLPGTEEFWHLVQRRLNREPVAYIINHCEFYGIDFYIDSRALIPRPESELLVEVTIEFAGQRFPSGPSFSIVDVGTGSGVIAIALAFHLPQAVIYATDVSAQALEVARINCRKHGVSERVHFLLGDMLRPLLVGVDIIIANLPYVRDSDLFELSPEIQKFEPIIALAGGSDGLEKMRQLLPQAREKLLPEGLMLLEIGQGQGQQAIELLKGYFPTAKVNLIPDLGGVERVLRVVS